MSKKGLKENQIFAARDTVEENDKIKAARRKFGFPSSPSCS